MIYIAVVILLYLSVGNGFAFLWILYDTRFPYRGLGSPDDGMEYLGMVMLWPFLAIGLILWVVSDLLTTFVKRVKERMKEDLKP